MKSERNSSYELLRIIAMFTIIVYHLYLFFIAPMTNIPFHKAIQMPLHIGVPLFILISGYYGIKVHPKGLFKLLAKVFVISVPLSFAYNIKNDSSWLELVKSMLFVSNSPYWFVRTYIILYLLSPIINYYLKNISVFKRLYLLAALFFVAVYIGILQSDPSLNGGKNILNFLFIYCIGDSIRYYEDRCKLKLKILILEFIILNVVSVSCYMFFYDTFLATTVWHLFYLYCSPFLILNAVILFLIIGRLKFQSKLINYVASSTFSMYLIHFSTILFFGPIRKMALWVYGIVDDDISLFLGLSGLTLYVMLICLIVDKILNPVSDLLSNFILKMYNSCCQKYCFSMFDGK